MSKPSTSSPKGATTLFRWRDRDTRHGVTRKTAVQAAQQLGLTETQLIHEAIAQYIAHALPQYEPDIGDIPENVYEAIRRRVPQSTEGRRILSSLIR